MVSPKLRAALAWTFALAAAVVLGWQRFSDSMGNSDRMDFDTIFIPAAQAVVAGHSPYEVAGYVYSPLYATLLAPVSHQPWVAAAVTATWVVCGVAAAALFARTVARGWKAGVICLAAVVTLFWNWPVTFLLWGLHPDLAVLLCMAGAVAVRTPIASGFILGLAAVLKTWPAAFVLWIVGLPDRVRRLGGFALAGLLAVGLALAVGGPAGPADMVTTAARMSRQPLVAYSTTGAPRLLFTESPNAIPLVNSPVLALVTTIALTAWVLALLVIALAWPGPRGLALFNLAFVVILLLPVSHYMYLLLPLPALWWWLARALDGDRLSLIPLTALSLWWAIAFRMPPGGDFMRQTVSSFLAIFISTLLAATVSVLATRTVHIRQASASTE